MRISDWMSEVCSSDLRVVVGLQAVGIDAVIGQRLAVDTPVQPQGPEIAERLLEFVAGRPLLADECLEIRIAVIEVGRQMTERRDRKSVVEGKRVEERVAFGGRRLLQKQHIESK